MEVLEALDRLRNTEWIDEEDEPMHVSFLPEVSEATLDEIERSIGAPLPDDYRALALACGGIETGGLEFDLAFFQGVLALEEILPHGMPFAHDGCGNYWVVDCRSGREARSPIVYVCHDPPVFVLQGNGLAEFIAALPAYERGERESPIYKVWESASWEVWTTNPGLLTLEEALASSDPAIRAFTEEIGEPCHIVDLRHASVGAGFSWGRYGLDTPVRRFGEERIFAYKRPRRA